MAAHQHSMRIYYEDTDAGGIVYHANFIKFGERGRTELLRAIGYSSSGLQEDPGIMFVVRHIEASYHRPARLEDLVTMHTSINSIGRSSFIMKQDLYSEEGHLIFESLVTLVCVDAKTVKPVSVPPTVKERFLTYQTEE